MGNIILKLVEGFGRGFAKQLKETLSNHMNNQDLERLLNEFSQKNNIVDSRGGGPCIWRKRVSIIGHGSSSAKTVDRAVDLALMCINTKLIEEMNNQNPLTSCLPFQIKILGEKLSDLELQGKTALVTGASKGIGKLRL